MKNVPIAIVVGLALGLFGSLAYLLATPETSFDTVARVELARSACWLGQSMLVVSGLFELARRSAGRMRRLVRAASLLLLVSLLWSALQAVIDIAVAHGERSLVDVARWGFIASAVPAFVTTILLVVAAGGIRNAPIAAPIALLAMIAGWIPYFSEELQVYLFEHRRIGAAYWLLDSAAWACGFVGLARRIAEQRAVATPDPQMAAQGFRYVHTGLRVCLIGAVVAAVFAAGVRMTDAAIIVEHGAPLLVVAAMLLVSIGLLRVAHAEVEGLPYMRLAIGGALTWWWVGLQYEQIVWLYRLKADHNLPDLTASVEQAWSIQGPLIATAALGLVGSAISAFAHARADDALREAASVRTLLYVVLSASAVGIQSQIYKAETRDGILVLTLVAAGAGIGALVAFAGLAKQAAESMDRGPTLPVARVNRRESP